MSDSHVASTSYNTCRRRQTSKMLKGTRCLFFCVLVKQAADHDASVLRHVDGYFLGIDSLSGTSTPLHGAQGSSLHVL